MKIEKFAVNMTKWIGSVSSVVIHTILFTLVFILIVLAPWLGLDSNTVLLVFTSIISVEAILLSVFIQFSVNIQSAKLHTIQENVEDIQENVEDIQEDVEDLQEDVEELNEDEEDEDDEEYKKIQKTLELLMKEIKELKKKK